MHPGSPALREGLPLYLPLESALLLHVITRLIAKCALQEAYSHVLADKKFTKSVLTLERRIGAAHGSHLTM